MDAATDWVVSGGRYALDFDGSNDYVSAGNMPNLGSIFDLTISFFLNVQASTAYFPIIEKYQGAVTSNGFLIYGVSGSGFEFAGRENVATYLRSGYSGASDIQIGTWVHLVGRKRATEWSIWVNGVMKNSQTLGTGTTSVNNTTRPFLIGGSTTDAAYSACLLDDVRLYSRAISHSEIRLLAIRRGIAYERRKRRSVYFNAAFFNPAWARNSNVILSPVGAA